LRAWLRRGLLSVVTLVALGVGLFRIGVPSPWVDEAVTVLVVQRPWSGIIALLPGADVPLVPYYLLAKAWAGMLSGLPTLVAVRSLSAVAAAITVAALFTLVARLNGIRTALLATLLLSSLAGFSRYAQEARPYALLMMTATLSWLAWDGWRRPTSNTTPPHASRLAGVGGAVVYVVSLIGSVLFQLFGIFQWPAQVVADLATPGTTGRVRVRRAMHTAAAMVVAALLVAFPVFYAATHGTGAPRLVQMSPRVLGAFFFQVLNSSANFAISVPFVILVAIAVVAVAARLRIARSYTRLVVIAVVWTAIPLLLSIGAAAAKSALLRPRYWMPIAVPLSVLAGVGALIAADSLWHVVRGRTPVTPRRRLVASVVAALALIGLLAVQAVLVKPEQLSVRREPGHALSLTPALKLVDSYLESETDLPFTVTPNTRTTVVWAMRPHLVERDVLNRLDQNASTVWPPSRDAADIALRLQGQNTMLWMRAAIMGTSITSTIKPKVAPKALQDLGFTLVSAQRAGNWWICILKR
jgi:mannosyltransferase